MARLVGVDENDSAVGLATFDYMANDIETLIRSGYHGRAGFASQELTNSNANIRRIRERMAAIN